MCSKDLIFQTFLIPSACRTVKSRLDLIAQCAVGENAGARVVDSWPRQLCMQELLGRQQFHII